MCRTCHKPHNAPSQQYLLVRQGEKGAMCRDCHPGQSAVIGSSHDLRKSAPDALNILKRPAREIGPCDSCHSVHSGSAAFMWAQAMPDATRKPSHFCSCCHAEGNCAASVAPKDFSHPMDVGVADTGASLRLPLFDGEGREKLAGTISCGTCHDVHNPRSPSAGGNDFLRSLPGEGTTGLCTHCHQQQALVAGSKHDLAITKPAFTNLLNQAPAEAACAAPVTLSMARQANATSGRACPDYRLFKTRSLKGHPVTSLQQSVQAVTHPGERPPVRRSRFLKRTRRGWLCPTEFKARPAAVIFCTILMGSALRPAISPAPPAIILTSGTRRTKAGTREQT